ncbi:MAG: oligoendopeptidase F [Candidatus Hydrogenedens sp.]|nr:oligoendopeptidase F [Candidatus Hydrogenedens sp.]
MSNPASPQPRKDVLKEHTWDLRPIFKSDAAWEKAFKALEAQLPTVSKFKGKLHRSAKTIHECCIFSNTLRLELEKLGAYAQLKYAEDLTNPSYQGMVARFSRLAMLVSEGLSHINPEIQAIPRKKMAEFLKEEILAEYKVLLQDLLRYRPHILSPAEERLLAMQGEVSEGPSKIFDQLTDGDLKFGTVKDETGTVRALTQSSFITFLESPRRNVRKEAFEKYYEVLEDHQYSVSSMLNASVLQDIYYARARNFPSAREAALFADRIPVAVYDSLITAVRDGLPSVHRYYALRKDLMRVKDIHFYDTYQPIVSGMNRAVDYDEAVDTICNSVEVLGEDYVKTLRKGLTTGRWVDRYENEGKMSGAFSYGVFGCPPYILMNYEEKVLNSMFTLAHEAGHSMHSYCSMNSQPYHYASYPIFLAEIASTFNEQLLGAHLLERAKSKKERAFLINKQIDEIRGTIIRQTMFAEFEAIIHEQAESGMPLTVETFRAIYRSLLDAYFGEDFVIDEVLELECLRIPHFYRAFYVFKYATGLSAAIALSQKVLSGGEKERNRYLTFLSAGGSRPPLMTLKRAGVDLTRPDAVCDAMKKFDSLVNELESLL